MSIAAWKTEEPCGALGISCFHEDPKVSALLFAADRLAHCKEIAKYLSKGTTVICDRYIWSSCAVQGASESMYTSRIFVINSEALKPDLQVWFNLSVEEANRRIDLRGKVRQQHEGTEALRSADKIYNALAAVYPNTFQIDGMLSIDERAEILVNEILQKFGDRVSYE